MARHRILRSYVLQEELRADLDQPLRRAPRLSLATMNTHDMPPFASFWSGDDIDERVRDGMLPADRAEVETKRRAAKRDALLSAVRDGQWLPSGADASAQDVLGAALRMLAAGPSSIVLVPLEDLWLEREPQNRPGSGAERGNWSRKARHGVDELPKLERVTAELRAVDAIRRRRP
jgi:4-alpha-glucanotransferase